MPKNTCGLVLYRRCCVFCCSCFSFTRRVCVRSSQLQQHGGGFVFSFSIEMASQKNKKKSLRGWMVTYLGKKSFYPHVIQLASAELFFFSGYFLSHFVSKDFNLNLQRFFSDVFYSLWWCFTMTTAMGCCSSSWCCHWIHQQVGG